MSTTVETPTATRTATAGTVEQVDPRTLVIAANVRGTVELDREFVASIRDLGVLEPVTAVRERGMSCGCATGSAARWAQCRPER